MGKTAFSPNFLLSSHDRWCQKYFYKIFFFNAPSFDPYMGHVKGVCYVDPSVGGGGFVVIRGIITIMKNEEVFRLRELWFREIHWCPHLLYSQPLFNWYTGNSGLRLNIPINVILI